LAHFDLTFVISLHVASHLEKFPSPITHLPKTPIIL
jgi:hypothetical protein